MAAQSQQIARLVQGDQTVLKPNAQISGEVQKALDLCGDAAPLGYDNHDSHKKQHQGKTGGGQEQRLPVFLHNQNGHTA